MPNLELVPANLTMSTIDLALMPLAGREFRLRNALQGVQGKYDFVVLDAPPSFGLLNLNALMAADDLIIPVLADFLSYDGLRLLFETVQGLETDLSHQLEHIFIVVNAFNQTFRIAREALDALQDALRRLPPRRAWSASAPSSPRRRARAAPSSGTIPSPRGRPTSRRCSWRSSGASARRVAARAPREREPCARPSTRTSPS